MAQIQRATALNNESQVELLSQDIATIIDEMNKGTDPSSIGYKSITADKLRLLKGALTALDFGVIAAGSFSQPYLIGIAATGATYEGPVYIQTAYADWFVDPPSLTNLYGDPAHVYPVTPLVTGGGLGGGGVAANDKMIQTCMLRSSVNTGTLGQVAQYVLQVYNGDSSSHHYYANFNVVFAATQLSAGS